MKTLSLEQATLGGCMEYAQHERVVITSDGKPALLIVGVEGMDEEQLELAGSSAFWRLMQERRAQKTVSRAELEARIAGATATS